MSDYDCDYLIIGSSFGGSVSALRLAEKGHRVIVLEQGRRIGAAEIEEGRRSARKLMWAPALGLDEADPWSAPLPSGPDTITFLTDRTPASG